MNLLGSQLGPYIIEREIGRGGMAMIYLATDTRLHEQVAIKVLLEHFAHDPMIVRRFRQEGENGTRLRHPNIVRVLDAGHANGYHYLVMDYAGRGSLAGLLRERRQAIEIHEALPILRKVAAALDYAHARGILHRDVKPSNILIGEQGQILLGDFGVARRLAADHTVMTTPGQTIGTPTYMSPEQVNDDINIDHRSDIYSLGVVAYAMLTAALPFDAESQMGLMRKIVDEAPTTPETYNPSLPSGVNYALLKALSKDPKRRYNSAAEFVDSLEKGITWTPAAQDWSTIFRALTPAAAHTASQSPPPPPPAPPVKGRGRGWLAWLGLLLVAAVAYLLYPYWQTGRLPFVVSINPPPADTPTLPATVESTPTLLPIATETATSTPAALAPAAPVPPTATLPVPAPTMVIAPIVLTSYQDPLLHIQLNVPKDWLPLRRGNALYIEAPDQSAWFLIEEMPHSTEITSARQLVNDYLRTGLASLRDVRLLNETTPPVDSASPTEFERHRQQMEALWVGGGRSTLYLQGVLATDRNLILGASADPGQEGLLAALVEPVFDSFTLLAVATATATSTPTALATPTASTTATSSATPVPTNTPSATPPPSATPTLPSTATVIPSNTPVSSPTPLRSVAPTATARKTPTSIAQENITKTLSMVEVAPTETSAPSATATPSFTLRPSATATVPPTATATPLATNTAPPLPTASSTPTVTRKPTATLSPTATGTATPTATRKPTSTPLPTVTPIPTTTKTGTATVTATATQTATRKPTSTPIPTATNMPTVAPTVTRKPTSTPVSTATPLPTVTKTGTATPTVTRKPTSTPLPTNTALPTATRTATATATRTATSTSVPTATPRPTLTNTATATALPTPKPTATQRPTATPVPSATPSATATLDLAATVAAAVKLTLEAQPTATATPLPTATVTPTPVPTATATAQPVATSTATIPPIPTRTPTAVPPTPIPPTSTPVPVAPSVTLIEPLDGVLSGTRTFRWATNVPLAANQGYELVFWPAGGDAMTQGFGPVGYSLTSEVTFDIDKKADAIADLVSGRTYQWGVLLVETNPYRRLQYLGGGHTFRFERISGGGGESSGGGDTGGGDSGGGQPAPTPEPPTETPRA